MLVVIPTPIDMGLVWSVFGVQGRCKRITQETSNGR